jgi:hypothetical protein
MKKQTLAFVGVGAVGLLGIVWYRSKQQSAAAAAATPATGAVDNSNIDPQTGYVSGSPEDVAALAQAQGAYAGGIYGLPQGSSGLGYPTVNSGPGSFTSNGEWAQYVEQYMVNNTGADPTTVGNAIGKYITGQPVSTAMTSVIDQAIAFGGYPPVAGPGGNPPGIVTTPTPGGGGGGGGGGGSTVTVPNVVGKQLSVGRTTLERKGFKVDAPRTPKGEIGLIESQTPRSGTKAAKGSTVSLSTSIRR